VDKLLEDAQIKLSSVASDIFGVSGREMLAALIAGDRDPKVLAQLARTRMRTKISALEEAFTGHFTDHHAFLLRTMLARIDETSADIAAVEARIDEVITPFARAVEKLDEIPGLGPTGAHVVVAEIGVDMSRFATAAHLCSWARFAPQIVESAGKLKGRTGTGHGNPYLARALGEAAVAAGKTDTFLGQRYRRIARRRGKKRAIVAGRPVDPGHHLAPALRPRRPVPRPRTRLPRHPPGPRTRQAHSRPSTRSPRLQGHLGTRCLTPDRPSRPDRHAPPSRGSPTPVPDRFSD
jgi:transposase